MMPKRKMLAGKTTSDLTFSSFTGSNDLIFPDILDLHVPDKSAIADITYGKGVFWKRVNQERYACRFSDLKTGVDCKNLPYATGSLDAVVFDPPYNEGFFKDNVAHLSGKGSHGGFRDSYCDKQAHPSKRKSHARVLEMYVHTGVEIWRVLKPVGTAIIKCMDEVCGLAQHLTHVEIIYAYELLGFYCKDIFITTRTNKPCNSTMVKQQHARKNHSYFLIFKKEQKKKYSNFSSEIGKMIEEKREENKSRFGY